MNYTEHLRGFYLRRQVKSISYNALILYYILTEQFNSCGFPKAMPIPITRLAAQAGLTKRQVIKARRELIEKGYIKIVPVPESNLKTFDIPPLCEGYVCHDNCVNKPMMIPMLANSRIGEVLEVAGHEKI